MDLRIVETEEGYCWHLITRQDHEYEGVSPTLIGVYSAVMDILHADVITVHPNWVKESA